MSRRSNVELTAAEIRRRIAADPPLRRLLRQQARIAFGKQRDRLQALVLQGSPPEPEASLGWWSEVMATHDAAVQILGEAFQVQAIDNDDYGELRRSLWALDGLEPPSYPPPASSPRQAAHVGGGPVVDREALLRVEDDDEPIFTSDLFDSLSDELGSDPVARVPLSERATDVGAPRRLAAPHSSAASGLAQLRFGKRP